MCFINIFSTDPLTRKIGRLLIDKRNNKVDVPHDYVELHPPARVRYLKIENVHVPTGKFTLSGFRVFGRGNGAPPDTVKNFIVLRGENEPRNAWLKWRQSDDAIGYTIYTGIVPDRLYNNIQVYGVNEYYFTGMEKGRPYYFELEASNENGIGKRTLVIKVN